MSLREETDEPAGVVARAWNEGHQDGTRGRMWTMLVQPIAADLVATFLRALGLDPGAGFREHCYRFLVVQQVSPKLDDMIHEAVKAAIRPGHPLEQDLRRRGLFSLGKEARRRELRALRRWVGLTSYQAVAAFLPHVARHQLGLDLIEAARTRDEEYARAALGAPLAAKRSLGALDPRQMSWAGLLGGSLPQVHRFDGADKELLEGIASYLGMGLKGDRGCEAAADAPGRAALWLLGDADERGQLPAPRVRGESHAGITYGTALDAARAEALARATRRITPGHSRTEDDRARRLDPAGVPVAYPDPGRQSLARIEAEELVALLTPEERSAVEALAEVGENYSAIARRLRRSDKTAKAVVERALRKLRRGAE